MAGREEAFAPMTDEEIETMMATLGAVAYGNQGLQNITSPAQASITPLPAGGGRALVPNYPEDMALLNSSIARLDSATHPSYSVPSASYSQMAWGGESIYGGMQEGQPFSQNFLPPGFLQHSSHGLSESQDTNFRGFDFDLLVPAEEPPYVPNRATEPFPISQQPASNDDFHRSFIESADTPTTLAPATPAMDFPLPQRDPDTLDDHPTEGTSTATNDIPSSAFFEDLIGEKMSQADRATRHDKIRAILNKDKVPIPEPKPETPEKPKRVKKRKVVQLQPGEKRRCPEMVEVLPYSDAPTWPQRRRKSNKMSDAEKELIDATNADLDRQIREWNKKKNNESAKRGRQRRQNRVSRLTEDLAQAQAERNFWQARAVAQGADADEWKDAPEGVKDDLVADFRIDPDDLLLPPEDDF
ncbi:hypothetical protein ACHAQA_005588 [Verticillium albo-atrum]